MRLKNEEALLHWPLAQHIITAGWLYNDGSLHRALDFRAAVGTPVYAAEGGTVETAYRWNGKRTQGDNNSYGNMIKLRHTDENGQQWICDEVDLERGVKVQRVNAVDLSTCVITGTTKFAATKRLAIRLPLNGRDYKTEALCNKLQFLVRLPKIPCTFM